ncbi:MAG: serine/threonine protein kinase [Kofleriaceae bacterium]|nr:serine/threonine protein kinase [Myxococcales bacterium]MCB9560167.1 serine/threonine protein kinase [Kofleriaceae bacterium]MCB9571271.1 serine/threonine protein kinase [Kofleriaceae bacterium]
MRVCPRCETRFPDGERFCLHDSSVLVEEEDMARLGTLVGNYRLDSILGRGGMGTVYSGEHVYIKKPVAVKILHPQFARYPEAVNRFLREARAATSINHPNIVDVTDFGLLGDGVVYFVMEYLPGKSLEDLIEREGAVELHRALNVGNQMALALEAAHEQGVIHRDLKPDNVMLLKRPGRRDLVRLVPGQQLDGRDLVTERESAWDFVKLLDFGIAKVLVPDELTAETVQGAVFGTPEYMSPEAARGEDVDHRADIYSLGVIMFDMLTGRPPFEAQAANEVLHMQIHKPPPSPREFAPHREITEAAERVILKAMQKDPDRRYQSMTELREDLQGAYGSISYRRHADKIGLEPRGAESRKKRLTEELDDWLREDGSGMSIEQARMAALVEQADKAFAPEPLSPAEAEKLADALDKALDDDE